MVKTPRRTDDARRLRRDSTDAERHLWYRLRASQLEGRRFRRQHSIGPYIVDFLCPSRRLVVELDGGQHVAAAAADEQRTRYLELQGYRVIRFWNHEVLGNCEGVLTAIGEALQQKAGAGATPSPGSAAPIRPLPDGER